MNIKPLIASAIAAASFALSAATATHAQRNPFPGLDSYCQATLKAQERGARINIREGAGLNSRVLHYGIAGDRVMLLRETANGDPERLAIRTDTQGYSWYRVGFPKTRATGWVRSDFFEPECFN